ncbi:MAG: hypothetical protein A4E38_01424 [Methanoregulaceae archaeon PtaB.Bin108]|nr:MAG: hypothetical protein A4E38_01424 [Methanoregulaceae archaeon PtaB.Bin108]
MTSFLSHRKKERNWSFAWVTKRFLSMITMRSEVRLIISVNETLSQREKTLARPYCRISARPRATIILRYFAADGLLIGTDCDTSSMVRPLGFWERRSRIFSSSFSSGAMDIIKVCLLLYNNYLR